MDIDQPTQSTTDERVMDLDSDPVPQVKMTLVGEQDLERTPNVTLSLQLLFVDHMLLSRSQDKVRADILTTHLLSIAIASRCE